MSVTNFEPQNTMNAMNLRLRQLEDIETELYLQRQTAIQRRVRDDEELQKQRQQEDDAYLRVLEGRDREEDVSNMPLRADNSEIELALQDLRQKRRLLCRSFFADAAVSKLQYQGTARATGHTIGPTTRSKSKAKPRARGAGTGATASEPSKKPRTRDGPPTANDSQGRALFTRRSDGKLVYLHCCVPGCDRNTFATVSALRKHITADAYRHKIEGLFTDNDHAIEVCGVVAPGQDDGGNGSNLQRSSMAPVANMIKGGILTPVVTNSKNEGAPSAVSASGTMVDLDGRSSAGSGTSRAKDLGGAYRTIGAQAGGSMGTPTRSQQAAEHFEGYLSTSSEDSSDEEPTEPVAANRVDQHKAAEGEANSLDRARITARDLLNMYAETEDRRGGE